MKFHLIYTTPKDLKEPEKSIEVFLKNACANNDIEFVQHDVNDKLELSKMPHLGSDDLVYRASTAQNAKTALREMISDTCTSFYTDWKSVYSQRAASYFIHNKYNLPVIPSFSGIPSTEEELQKCVADIGPFPVIVKVLGGSLGVGVMRLDSIESLRSVLDYLRSVKANVLIRKYIKHDYYVRAVVVGDKVVASYAAYKLESEFRTNAGDDTHQKREALILPAETQEMLVKAVKLLGIETGGVDLLYDGDSNPYIAEVNFPHNFTMAQVVTGIDVGDALLKHLILKAKNKTSDSSL